MIKHKPSFAALSGGAAVLAAVLSGAPALAADGAWQIRQGNVTVIASGDRQVAARAATRVLQMQNVARWLFGWPAEYRPPPVLAFALTPAQFGASFEAQPPAVVGRKMMLGETLVTTQMTLLVAPLSSKRNFELDGVQLLYGQALARGPPAQSWPPCARQGMELLFSAASFNASNQFYMAGAFVSDYRTIDPDTDNGLTGLARRVDSYPPLEPAQFLPADAPVPATALDFDKQAYACYLLSHLVATSPPAARAAFFELFSALGRGTPLEQSVPEALGGSLEEFTSRYLQFAHRHAFSPAEFNLRVEFPEPLPPAGELEPVPAERLVALLSQVCSKLSRCRHAPAAAPPPASP